MFARRGIGIAALQTVQADQLQRLVLLVSGHGDGSRSALAGDFHRIAFSDVQRVKSTARQARDTTA